MRQRRNLETPEDRSQRLRLQAQMKRDAAAANDVAVDRMIRRNIEQYGP